MATRIVLTYADLVAMPSDGKRYELHEGEIYMTAAPRPRHQQVVGNLSVARARRELSAQWPGVDLGECRARRAHAVDTLREAGVEAQVHHDLLDLLAREAVVEAGGHMEGELSSCPIAARRAMTTSERSRRDSSGRDQISPKAQRKASVPTSPSARCMLARSVAGSAAGPATRERAPHVGGAGVALGVGETLGRPAPLDALHALGLAEGRVHPRKAAMAAGNPA
jgi:hypothetical protein